MSGFGVAGAPPAPTISGWQHLRTGKVRDLYKNDSDEILLVASDRISAFDWVLPTTIPNKGAILTQLSLFWFELLEVPFGILRASHYLLKINRWPLGFEASDSRLAGAGKQM